MTLSRLSQTSSTVFEQYYCRFYFKHLKTFWNWTFRSVWNLKRFEMLQNVLKCLKNETLWNTSNFKRFETFNLKTFPNVWNKIYSMGTFTKAMNGAFAVNYPLVEMLYTYTKYTPSNAYYSQNWELSLI